MLPKIKPIFYKPPSNLCLHEPVAIPKKLHDVFIVGKEKPFEIFDIEYKCKHCDEIQQIENK